MFWTERVFILQVGENVLKSEISDHFLFPPSNWTFAIWSSSQFKICYVSFLIMFLTGHIFILQVCENIRFESEMSSGVCFI